MIEVKGEKLEVIDTHMHMGMTPVLREMSGKERFLGEDAVQLMDELGIDKCVAFTSAAADYSAANDVIIKQVKKYPDRIIGFGRVDPRVGVEKCIKEIERFVNLGLRGIKMHPVFEPHFPNDRAIYPMFETVRKHEIPILYHVGMSTWASPALVADLALDFQEIPVIISHFAYERYMDAIVLAKRVKNLFLDTSGSYVTHNLIKMAVKAVGIEKVIFGSDTPFEPAEREVEKLVKYSGLTTDELRQVFSGNIKRILRINKPSGTNE